MSSELGHCEGELMTREQRLADFPALAEAIDGNAVTYLDSAASSLKPRQVIDAVVRYYARNGSNVHRGAHYLSEAASVAYEEGRNEVGAFVGAAGNEIVFTRNTTEALNIVANGLALSEGEFVITSLDAHHSAYLPWLRKGQVRFIRVNREGVLDLDHYAELLRQGPKAVALTHCTNVTGVVMNLREMAKMAKEHGALVVADLAQSISHHEIDVHDCHLDFAAFSAHKMLGPTGIGVLYGKDELLNKLDPLVFGGGMVDWVDVRGCQLRKIPHRFEAGTPHIAGVYGLVAAIRYLQHVGYGRLAAHDELMGRALMEAASQRPYLRVVGPHAGGARRSGMLSFQVSGVDDLGTFARVLSDSYGIMCRSGWMCAQPFVDHVAEGPLLRASCHLYNTLEDVKRLFDAMDDLV